MEKPQKMKDLVDGLFHVEGMRVIYAKILGYVHEIMGDTDLGQPPDELRMPDLFDVQVPFTCYHQVLNEVFLRVRELEQEKKCLQNTKFMAVETKKSGKSKAVEVDSVRTIPVDQAVA